MTLICKDTTDTFGLLIYGLTIGKKYKVDPYKKDIIKFINDNGEYDMCPLEFFDTTWVERSIKLKQIFK